jgi:hypothetical protein
MKQKIFIINHACTVQVVQAVKPIPSSNVKVADRDNSIGIIQVSFLS